MLKFGRWLASLISHEREKPFVGIIEFRSLLTIEVLNPFANTRETAVFGGVSVQEYEKNLGRLFHEGSGYVLSFEIGQLKGGFYSTRTESYTPSSALVYRFTIKQGWWFF